MLLGTYNKPLPLTHVCTHAPASSRGSRQQLRGTIAGPQCAQRTDAVTGTPVICESGQARTPDILFTWTFQGLEGQSRFMLPPGVMALLGVSPLCRNPPLSSPSVPPVRSPGGDHGDFNILSLVLPRQTSQANSHKADPEQQPARWQGTSGPSCVSGGR